MRCAISEDVLLLQTNARQHFLHGREEHALRHYALLSELGSANGHANAADLWAYQQNHNHNWSLKCWRSTGLGAAASCEFDYRQRSAACGHVDAMLRVAEAYGNSGKPALAYRWTNQAGKAGSVEANLSLAYFKEYGIGTTKDLSGACATYCSLLELDKEPILVRGTIFDMDSN